MIGALRLCVSPAPKSGLVGGADLPALGLIATLLVPAFVLASQTQPGAFAVGAVAFCAGGSVRSDCAPSPQAEEHR